ncbi:hypothetical protein [Dyella sp. KRB-257]|uniref:hypothetical protein n=1 Tax=Dyella sp. KRB-257 TaxID=3400915 RepID=UPI003C2E16BF
MIERVPLEFIVLGLPRSGTTWLANWLTTDDTLCLHDPFALGMPETWPLDKRLRGISCTAAALMRRWLSGYCCPIAVIERHPSDCDRSLQRLGLQDTALYADALVHAPGRRFRFEDLWNEEAAEQLWKYLLPTTAFDRTRYRLLRSMRIEPARLDDFNYQVMLQLLSGGLFEGRL